MRPRLCIGVVFGVSLALLLLFSVLRRSESGHERHCEREIPNSSGNADRVNSVEFELPTKRAESNLTPACKPRDDFMQKIVYNRVGKCGSRSMLTLISRLSKRNKFTLHLSKISNQTNVPIFDLIDVVKSIDDLPYPSLYSRHLHYVGFAKFGVKSPVHINMIRDPIERFRSQYHFLRYGDNGKSESRLSHPWTDREREMDINECVLTNHPLCSPEKLFYIVPYFCGQEPLCGKPGKESLHWAKLHAMENYLVVGYLEDFDGMLEVLEKLLPRYFNGASKLWSSFSSTTINRTTTVNKGIINATANAVLRVKMREEYDFYNFVKHRFDQLKRQIEDVDGGI